MPCRAVCSFLSLLRARDYSTLLYFLQQNTAGGHNAVDTVYNKPGWMIRGGTITVL
jgi:hypothetical protein